MTVPAFAGAQTTESLPINLDAVVVTAARRETLLMDSPVAIQFVGKEELGRNPSSSIADLIRDVPGVFVADNSLPGMQRLRIRGEDARRSLVLIDGQEISDHSTFGPPLLVDPSFVDHIEVVRGPHSTLYGSRAAGGVINIVTEQRSGEYTNGSIGLAYNGASAGRRANVSLAGADDGWHYRISASASEDSDRETPSGALPDTAFESKSFMGRLGWSNDDHSIGLIYDRYDMSSEASTPESLLRSPFISRFQLDLPQRDRERLAIFYDGWNLTPSMNRFHIDAFVQSVDRNITQEIAGVLMPPTRPPTLYDYFNDDFDTIKSTGLNLQSDWNFSDKHTIVAGLSYLRDDLDKTITRTGFTQRGPSITPADLVADTDAQIATIAIFAQDTWKLNRVTQITAGLRQYLVNSDLKYSNDPALPARSSDDSHTVGSLAIVYRPSDAISWRASWGQGYVFPTLLHLHTGSLFGQGNLTRPNPNLKPETSDNFEVGLRYQNERFTADLAVFKNRAEDYIASVRASNTPELGWQPTENTYMNLDSAKARGAEVLLMTRIGDLNTNAYLQGTYLRRELEFPTFTTTSGGQPELTGRMGVRYRRDIGQNTHCYVDAYMAGGGDAEKRTTRSTTSTDSWTTLNLSVGVEFGANEDWWIGLDALNLSDEEYRPSVDELTQAGRHLRIGTRWNF